MFVITPAHQVIFEKFERALVEHFEASQIIKEQEDRKAAAVALYDKAMIAAELFGFNPSERIDDWLQFKAKQVTQDPYPPNAGILHWVQPTLQTKPKTVRDYIVEEAENAFPNPIRAKRVRAKLEELGMHVHEKTVGMSLYRLSQDGLMRRVGKADWYWVPEDERPKPLFGDDPPQEAPIGFGYAQPKGGFGSG